jgi:hypothetical protein
VPADTENVYFDVPGVAMVGWEAATETVLVEWAGWADATEFTALLDAEIRALREHQGTRLLVDCRLQQVLTPTALDWADREWMPRALAAGLKRMAVLLPETPAAAADLKGRLGRVPKEALQVMYFDEVEPARDWLAAR